MSNELTSWCTHYYRLTKQFSARAERFKNMLDNAPLYTSQNTLSDIDDMISYDRRIQAVGTKGHKMFKELTDTAHTILGIMRHYKIPPRTIFTAQIPGELEYEVWANENGDVFIEKIRDLPQEPENPNVITIKCWDGSKGDDEDDEDG